MIRTAELRDAQFLAEMVVEAINWDADSPRRSAAEVLSHPTNLHYVAGFPRDDDIGLIAESEDGRAVGAAWLRCFADDDRGYGFIATDIPELTIAVVSGYRGQGIGDQLLAAVVAEARRHGHRALSLSVEPANPAVRLYERHGFRPVGEIEGARTMRLDLSNDR